jgi:hypothetical protein
MTPHATPRGEAATTGRQVHALSAGPHPGIAFLGRRGSRLALGHQRLKQSRVASASASATGSTSACSSAG